MNERHRGFEKILDPLVRKFTQKTLVSRPEIFHQIVFDCRGKQVRQRLEDHLAVARLADAPGDHIPGDQLPGRRPLAHEQPPVVPQIAHGNALVEFDFENFVQPEMAAAHAFEERALARRKLFGFPFEKQIEHRTAV